MLVAGYEPLFFKWKVNYLGVKIMRDSKKFSELKISLNFTNWPS